jgi:hypothetical protein
MRCCLRRLPVLLFAVWSCAVCGAGALHAGPRPPPPPPVTPPEVLVPTFGVAGTSTLPDLQPEPGGGEGVLSPEQAPGGPRTEASGGLATSVILEALRPRSDEIRRCFDALLLRSAEPVGGSVVLRVTVGPEGSVAQAEVVGGTIEDAEFRSCVVQHVRTVGFPRNDGPTVFTCPFAFDGAASGGLE